MRLDVTYEKDDILRLVERDLEANHNFRRKEDAPIEYRGPLRVKFTVDVADPVLPIVGEALRLPLTNKDASPADSVDMSEVLAASHRLEEDAAPRFDLAKRPPRTLAPN